MKNKRYAAIILVISMLLTSALVACKDEQEDTFDPDTPGDDFSGSIADKDEEKDEAPGEQIDEGDETKTYLISNADELLAMKRKGTYVLTADIDMTGKEWIPVGTFEAPFVGTFDGAGYTIKGLTVTDDIEGTGECISYTYSYAGLFGFARDAVIKNVKLTDVNIKVDTVGEYRIVYAAAIAGMTIDCNVTGCHVLSGKVTSSSAFFKAYSAGITAFSFGSHFIGCTVNADISVTGSAITSVAGGINAQIGLKSTVNKCSSSGTVSTVSTDGNAYSGGLVGYVNNSTVTYCSSSSDVSSATECNESETGKAGACFSGGVMVYITNSLSESCTVTAISSSGTVSANSVDYTAYAGGIAGYMAYTAFTHSYSSSSVTAHSELKEAYAAGICSYTSSSVKYDGIFFVGNVSTEATKDDPRCGLLTAYNASSDDKPIVTVGFAHLPLSEMQIKINGKVYGSNGFPTDTLIVHGEEYSSSALKSKNILTGDLGWNADDWSFSMSAYPSVNLTVVSE